MLTKEDVLKIAKLSKLEFQEDEIEKFQTDLNKILEHMEILNNVDTVGVEPLFNVLDLKDRLRKDEVQSVDIKKELLKNAPNKDDDFIIVPKIVSGGRSVRENGDSMMEPFPWTILLAVGSEVGGFLDTILSKSELR